MIQTVPESLAPIDENKTVVSNKEVISSKLFYGKQPSSLNSPGLKASQPGRMNSRGRSEQSQTSNKPGVIKQNQFFNAHLMANTAEAKKVKR